MLFRSFTITISQASQNITFNALSGRTKTSGTDTFTVSAFASSLLTVSFSSATTSVCTVSSTTVTLVTAGICTINADQTGNSNYLAASQVSRSFTVSSAISITTPNTGLSGTYGTSYSLTISSSGGAGSNSFTLASGSLPSGVTLNASTGTISGTPSATGNFAIAISVSDSNSATATTSSFTISISSGGSSSTITVAVGTLYYRTTKSISAVASVAGKLTFKANNTTISGCKNLAANSGNSFTRSCSYKPSTRGYVTISVTLVPTDTSYNSSVTKSDTYFVYQRSGSR